MTPHHSEVQARLTLHFCFWVFRLSFLVPRALGLIVDDSFVFFLNDLPTLVLVSWPYFYWPFTPSLHMKYSQMFSNHTAIIWHTWQSISYSSLHAHSTAFSWPEHLFTQLHAFIHVKHVHKCLNSDAYTGKYGYCLHNYSKSSQLITWRARIYIHAVWHRIKVYNPEFSLDNPLHGSYR